MTPHCLGHYSPPERRRSLQMLYFGRGSLKAGKGEQQFTGAPELEKFKVLLVINPQPTSTTSTVHWGRAGAMGSPEERAWLLPASAKLDSWLYGFSSLSDGWTSLLEKQEVKENGSPAIEAVEKRVPWPVLRNIMAQIPSPAQRC